MNWTHLETLPGLYAGARDMRDMFPHVLKNLALAERPPGRR
jgi:hypothetical protein